MMASLQAPSWDALPGELWARLAQQGLLQMHLKQKLNACQVEVSVLEASAPIVFAARPKKAFEVGELVLVPWVSTDLVPFAEGGKLKHPKCLHPHLPFTVMMRAGSFTQSDSAAFFLKSPLASASSAPKEAPAPFWACLQEQHEGDANMAATVYRLELGDTKLSFGSNLGPKAKRGRHEVKESLAVVVPILVNTKPVKKGDTLVFTGELCVDDEGEGDE